MIDLVTTWPFEQLLRIGILIDILHVVALYVKQWQIPVV